MNPEHEHAWGLIEHSHFAGTAHRKCVIEGCDVINAYDDEDDGEVWFIAGWSPLDYHGYQPQRFSLFAQDAGKIEGDPYFTEPDLVAFIDWDDGTRIYYMSVRMDRRGEGFARRLVQAVYDSTEGQIDWGEIYADEARTLFTRFREQNPNRHHRGKFRT